MFQRTFKGLFLLCGTVCSLTTIPPSPPPGCLKDGTFYHEGEKTRPSPCEWCQCEQGRMQCMIADCFIVECVDSVQHPDQCCPTCPNGKNCYAGNKVIPAGKDVQIDNHTTCRCPEQFGFGMTAHRALCSINRATTIPPL